MKKCRRCDRNRPFSEYNKRSGGSLDGYQSYCKECNNAVKNKNRKLGDSHRANLKRKYGITPEQYLEILESQNDVCAICKQSCSSNRRLAVDHNHITGKIRGLLCFNCNAALGKLKADLGPDLLQAALDYITIDDTQGSP